MKKLLILLLPFIPILCNAQNFKIRDQALPIKIHKYDNVNLYKDVKNIQQLVFNIAASFQRYANDTVKVIYKPIVIINQVPYIENTYKDISFNEIENFQIIKDINCWPGTKSSKIIIVIKTKQ